MSESTAMPSPAVTSWRSRLVTKVAALLGVAVAIAGGVFVAGKMATGWSAYGPLVARAQWGWLLPAIGLAALGMTSMGLIWRRIVVALGGVATRREIFAWYHLGQLGKYLPGGLWPIVGRAELAARGGLSRPVAYNSVGLSMAATYLCAAVVCACLLPFVLLAQGSAGISLAVFALIPVGLAALHPAIVGRVIAVAERLTGKGTTPPSVPPWRTSVAIVGRHAPPWLANGVATWCVALVFDSNAPATTLVFAGIMSWVVGFVVVFVPGGIGVREGAFTAIASVAMASEIAAVVAVVSRLVFVAVDAVGALLAIPVRASIRRSAHRGHATLRARRTRR